MIEFILASACNGCARCVEICPTTVFDPPVRGVPVIARPQDCQTCFMCEAYCREDAIFVGPDPDKIEGFDLLAVAPLMGEMRRHHGWDEWAKGGRYPDEHWRTEEVFARARST